MRRKVFWSLAVLAFIGGGLLVVAGLSRGDNGTRPTSSLTPFGVRSPTPADPSPPVPSATADPSDDTPTVAAPTAAVAAPTAAVAAPTPYGGSVGRMIIPSIGVDYPLEQIGVLPGNTLDTPHDAIGKIGWYYIYQKPGFGGNAVFSAHVNYDFKQGPFANLAKVQAGDEIIVQMDNGSQYTYRVFRKQRYDISDIPMAELIWPSDRPAGEEWITLITCGGNFVATQANGLGEYTQRDVVIAERIS